MNNPVESIRFLLSFFLLSILLIVITGALLFTFWIWMVIDCAKRNFRKDIDKVVWILVVVFLNVLGAAIYYFVVKVSDKKQKEKNKS